MRGRERGQRIVWVDRFPIRVGVRSNGPWVAKIRRVCKGYYDHLSDDDLWLCQSFDDDDFVVLPYVTLLKILDVTTYFRAHGELPP